MKANKKQSKPQARGRSLHPVVRRNRYRVYNAKKPMNHDGTAYRGSFPLECGWYWVREGCALTVKVYGRERARWVASLMDRAANTGDKAR